METDCSVNRSPVYFTSICRDVHIDHENGTLVGTSNIGQFISALPLTTDCNSFSLEIIDTGKRSIIAIGVCPRNYPATNLPGWKAGSVGYHADNGGIYVALGTAVKESEPCTDGDVMKCEVNFKNNSVLFFKNKKLIHTVDNLNSISNLHAAVGIYSDGETVRLLETRPWQKTRKVFPRLQQKFSDKEEIVYHACISREVKICQSNGILTYIGDSENVPVGQFISASPLTPNCNSFSFEIIDTGKRSIIAIGVCPRNYPATNLPGWKAGSVGYHADNGGIYVALGTAVKESEPCTDGDVMKCEVNFKNISVLFYKNEKLIHTVDNLDSISNLHAAVGIYSDGETVRLLETRPWQKTRKVFPRLQQKFSDKEETVYHACISREVKICQSNGILTYIGDSENVPVGQFISASPLTPNCNSFSFEIAQPGKHCYIAIGVCPKTYPPNHQPGWTTGSFAYHADDGGIFMQYGVARRHTDTCNEGDVMKCLIDFEREWIVFYKNDKKIHTIKHLPIVDNLHAAVGFHSVGEVVRLLEVKPWKMFDGLQRDGRVWEKNTKSSVRCKNIYFTSICREVKVCHETGIVTYNSKSPVVPVGQFISACPLTNQCNSFSFEIKDPGDNCYIAIGVCPKTYPPDRQPGWNRGSFGYHADDGGIFTGGGTTLKFKETCGAGDVMKCQVDFRSRCILFYKNNRLMSTIKNVSKVDNFHASIGLHSVGEEVRLLETEPWENIKSSEVSCKFFEEKLF
ncbi:SPRY domain-containing protein 3 [Bulinus truncatus]|nr:SPRY domain-containing protein 3 [Bulinus truncatus]